MTVYKAIKPEAEAAAELAVALRAGRGAAGRAVNGETDNGTDAGPVGLLDPGRRDEGQRQGHGHQGRLLQAVDEICTGAYAAACTGGRDLA